MQEVRAILADKFEADYCSKDCKIEENGKKVISSNFSWKVAQLKPKLDNYDLFSCEFEIGAEYGYTYIGLYNKVAENKDTHIHIQTGTYLISAGNGYKRKDGNKEAFYGKAIPAGSKVGVNYSKKNGTLEYFVNGISAGVAF